MFVGTDFIDYGNSANALSILTLINNDLPPHSAATWLTGKIQSNYRFYSIRLISLLQENVCIKKENYET